MTRSLIASLPTDELVATRRSLHRTLEAMSLGRLGWDLPAEPALLANLCLAIGVELRRRSVGIPFACPSCRATVAAATPRLVQEVA